MRLLVVVLPSVPVTPIMIKLARREAVPRGVEPGEGFAAITNLKVIADCRLRDC